MARIRLNSGDSKPAKRRETVRLTIDIPASLHFRIAGLAALRKQPKKAFVIKLLDQGCAGYKADETLKAVAADSLSESETAA